MMKQLVLSAMIILTSTSAFAGRAHRGDTRTIGRDSYSLISTNVVCGGVDMQTMGSARQNAEADAIAKARARLEKFDNECVEDGGTVSEVYVRPSSHTDVYGFQRVCNTAFPVIPGHRPGRPNAPAQRVVCQSIPYGCEIYSNAEVKHACN